MMFDPKETQDRGMGFIGFNSLQKSELYMEELLTATEGARPRNHGLSFAEPPSAYLLLLAGRKKKMEEMEEASKSQSRK